MTSRLYMLMEGENPFAEPAYGNSRAWDCGRRQGLVPTEWVRQVARDRQWKLHSEVPSSNDAWESRASFLIRSSSSWRPSRIISSRFSVERR